MRAHLKRIIIHGSPPRKIQICNYESPCKDDLTFWAANLLKKELHLVSRPEKFPSFFELQFPKHFHISALW